MKIATSIKNNMGGYGRISIFDLLNDGVIKRTPKLMAEKFKNLLISNIEKNAFGFKLSNTWQAQKRRKGADARPFIEWGDYRDSVRVIRGRNGRLEVGFLKTKLHPRANKSFGKLAIQLEFGDASNNLPARPLWRMTADEFTK